MTLGFGSARRTVIAPVVAGVFIAFPSFLLSQNDGLGNVFVFLADRFFLRTTERGFLEQTTM